MSRFPFISSDHAIALMRVVTALIFVIHATVRVVGSTIDQFAAFLEDKGFSYGVLIVWCITIYEIAGGLLMAVGIFARWLAIGFMVIIVAGIFIIHAANGWFVGEHGTGGMEYSILLVAVLIVIATSDKK
ncbi:MAG TPA: DoxX family protein [Cyclobacteriaceae bacterium]|nr:DoxX family protein [Cyclobacteriaceae bacterium]HMV09575.1 DoxX family protein [Cyclobacteriaceae bacterium]HMV90483.1 DoxX family protein [Cyclobacteriaceae bacterium]HMX01962.1 DoxX family protein [Cyclobacteriaceae bacterium]HMX51937.1 DoxX family protein [Cyclobacteriaceae bacterium]